MTAEREGRNDAMSNEQQRGNYEAPPTWMSALEYRAVGERMQFAALRPMLRHLKKGDGHPVIVLPGFTAGDRSTQPLRDVLKDLGYRTYGWGSGVNIGPTPAILDGLVRRLDRAHSRSGHPVSIVGWSLGGLYARELARAYPDLVRQVVTLGSPIQMTGADRSGASRMWEAMRRYHSPGFMRNEREGRKPPLTVPATSIYSRTDGVVTWQASLIRKSDISENIRVFGSHCGLGFNTSVIYAIADRLSQPEGVWKPFRVPWYVRGAYPPADHLDVTLLPADAA